VLQITDKANLETKVSEKIHFFDAIDANKRNSYLLMAFMSLLSFFAIFLISILVTDDLVFAGFIAILIAGLYIVITYNLGLSFILSVSGARPVTKQQNPYLNNVIEGLSIAAGIPVPKAYIINDPSPNAFATGRDPQHAVVVVTQGLLDKLDRRELSAVVAHEISHIGNYDIRYMMVSVVMVGFIAIVSRIVLRSIAHGGLRAFAGSGGGGKKGGGAGVILIIMIVFMILAPIFAELARLALSRQREFLADANSARLTRDPTALVSALKKVSSSNTPVQSATSELAPLYFSDPLAGKFSGLFRTHPPTDKRIERLNALM